LVPKGVGGCEQFINRGGVGPNTIEKARVEKNHQSNKNLEGCRTESGKKAANGLRHEKGVGEGTEKMAESGI